MIFKRYKLFLENKQSNEEIDSICKKYRIENYTINEDGTVDVDGNVYLYDENLVKLPLKFGKVTGYFSCSNNVLTSLEGSPYWVGKNFNCSNNELTTLVGGPEIVVGNYSIFINNVVNFKGFPEDFDAYFNCEGNPVYKLLEDVPDNKINKFIYWCNELNVIDDEGNVNEEWMEEVHHKIGLKYEKD